ncbi:hypothetical protein HGRIS_014033 [Hohenbuehelia grisea]|uniref:Uncharacterized protein n=1 Tax=Hohenbuehelia grisea TaxID=104357 RepID=A0ABR3JT39_9AGAR
MEMDFEVMLCDFRSGVDVLSMLRLNAEVPDDLSKVDITPGTFEVINAGSWHNLFPGDTRVSLDASRMVSFYDLALVPSLAPVRRNQERRLHRLQGISKADVERIMGRLDAVLRQDTQLTSGFDWSTLARVLIDRFGARLELLRYILDDSSPTIGNLRHRAKLAHHQLRTMIQPYIIISAIPTNTSNPPADATWVKPIFKLCASSHIAHLERVSHRLSPSEKTNLNAIRETKREICRNVARMWAQGVAAGLDSLITPIATSGASDEGIAALLHAWRAHVSGLMDWLDWSIWVTCVPVCSFEEICYLPTWPYFLLQQQTAHAQAPSGDSTAKAPFFNPGVSHANTGPESLGPEGDCETEECQKPKPRCIRRFEPYGL